MSNITLQDLESKLRTSPTKNIDPASSRSRSDDGEVNVSVVPYLRSRQINFYAFNLRPNTRVYPYFDSIPVSSYVQPANSSYGSTGTEGDALTSDSNGNLYGIFRVPNDSQLRFRAGKHMFSLQDIPEVTVQSEVVTTYAQACYNGEPDSTECCDVAPGNPGTPKPAPAPTTPSATTVTDRMEWNDGGGVKRRKNYTMASTSGTVTIYFSFGTAHDKFFVRKNGNTFTDTANTVSLDAAGITLMQGEGLNGSGISYRNPEAIGGAGSTANTINGAYVEGSGTVSFTHDPSTGREYTLDIQGRSPWYIRIDYPADESGVTESIRSVVNPEYSLGNLGVDNRGSVVFGNRRIGTD